MEKAQICGTEHETNLKKLNIIGEIGAGQYDCKSEIFYTIDSVKETSKEIFGKELTQFTAAIDKNSGYYYYANGNIAIICYAGLLGTTYTMTDFYVKDSTLSIEVSSSTNESYKLNFKVDGENFYFASIHKI